MDPSQLKDFLDEKAAAYNRPTFIAADPIQVPHRFNQKEDIEIAAFLTAAIAWGNRKGIIKNAASIMERMGNSPFDFVVHFTEKKHAGALSGFVHRTFNSGDLIYFVKALQFIYKNEGGLEAIFNKHKTETSLQPAISVLKQVFFSLPHLPRTQKHLGDPLKNSAAKRTNMFLRWMVRKDNNGVDFGIWETLPPRLLSCPLDVHTGNVARKLNLITRKQNDAKTLAQLDAALRAMDAEDPVKYDFALFGLGACE
ncbi:MAG: TIGR02757 family protein, partial [Marinirhabdus sp.]